MLINTRRKKAFVFLGLLAVIAVTNPSLAVRDSTSQSSPYQAWKHGPSTDPNFFPIGVWLQDPKNAMAYRALGINTYVGLWEGPTEEQLAELRKTGIRVVCYQNEVGLRHLDDPTILAWLQDDEPDNYQPKWGPGHAPPIPPARIIEKYQEMRRNDPTRPVYLNLGQGVANDKSRGAGASLSDYSEYIKGADIVSFDIYPIVGEDGPASPDFLWHVAKGVERLKRWSNGKKIVWNIVECTHINNPDKLATPEQVRAEVWMSLVHGSMGITYFAHQFKPREIEAALLADPKMCAAVKAINQQISELAPVLNSPTVEDGGAATPDDPLLPVDLMVKQQGGNLYLFAVGMRNRPGHVDLRFDLLKKLGKNATIKVIGEDRNIPCWNGRFEDSFKPYDVHFYKVAVPAVD